MIIYRLQNVIGEGIYYSNVASEICDELRNKKLAYSLYTNHPIPSFDTKYLNNINKKDRLRLYNIKTYGFKRYEHYRNWFYDDTFLNMAHEKGISLYLFDVHKTYIVFGKAQCSFNKYFAKQVGIFHPLCPKETLTNTIRQWYNGENQESPYHVSLSSIGV